MGSSKTHQYSLKQRLFARTAKAIAHPARVSIIQHLSVEGLVTNYQIMNFTGLSEGTVSQHLKELVHAGLIADIYVVHKHYYKLTNRAQKAVTDLQLLFGQPDIPYADEVIEQEENNAD